MRAHVKALTRKVRQRMWVLRHLRSAGFEDKDLVEVYTATIRPVIEFASVVYHPTRC